MAGRDLHGGAQGRGHNGHGVGEHYGLFRLWVVVREDLNVLSVGACGRAS